MTRVSSQASDVGAGQRFQRPQRDVAEIADRRRHQIERRLERPRRDLGLADQIGISRCVTVFSGLLQAILATAAAELQRRAAMLWRRHRFATVGNEIGSAGCSRVQGGTDGQSRYSGHVRPLLRRPTQARRKGCRAIPAETAGCREAGFPIALVRKRMSPATDNRSIEPDVATLRHCHGALRRGTRRPCPSDPIGDQHRARGDQDDAKPVDRAQPLAQKNRTKHRHENDA